MPRSIPARALARQGTLPFSRKSPGRAVRVKENVVEAETDFELTRAGFHFLNTTTRLKQMRCQCPRCGHVWFQRPNFATGQDRGIPDRLIYAPGWFHRLLPATLWLGVELKGSHTPFSCVEQEALAEAGHTVVARAGDVALEATRQVSRFFDYVADLEAGARRLIAGIRARHYAECWHAADEAERLLEMNRSE